MSCHSVALVLLLLYHSTFTCSKEYFIVPSLSDPCPLNFSCLTLSQLADGNLTDNTSLRLLFLPGNHTINQVLTIKEVDNVLLTKYEQDKGNAYVHCASGWGRFDISESTSATIKNLHFIGCSNNAVYFVKNLTVINCTFEQATDGRVVLMFNFVTATLLHCSFLSNTLPYFRTNITLYKRQITDYIHSYRNIPQGILYVAFSNVSINSSSFKHNRAIKGGAIKSYYCFVFLHKNTFNNNSAHFGGVMFSFGSVVTADNNSSFSNNVAQVLGGVMNSCNDTVTIKSSTFVNNSADKIGGVIMASCFSIININNCNFSQNSADIGGGVIESTDTTVVKIKYSTFTNNKAVFGGVVETTDFDGFVSVNNCTFIRNNASYGGILISSNNSLFVINNSTFSHNNYCAKGSGVLEISGNCIFLINNSTFEHNSASREGGVMVSNEQSFVTINNCSFAYNNAPLGGVLRTSVGSSFDIINCNFTHNNASTGGVMRITSNTTLNIKNSLFANNSANITGAVIACTGALASLWIDSSHFYSNVVYNQGGGIVFSLECSTRITDCNFEGNIGSVYSFNSDLSLGGYTKFINCSEPPRAIGVILTSHEAGAITTYQSTVLFENESVLLLSDNKASHGGAIMATESTIIFEGETTIHNNTANISGGGIYLKQSHLKVKQVCHISTNSAVNGGGLFVRSSTVGVFQSGQLSVTNNNAQSGGGLYLEVNPKLYVLKRVPTLKKSNLMTITANHANYGGAIYVADETNLGACSQYFECFVQILSLHHNDDINIDLHTDDIQLKQNTAETKGSNLYGGLLDRCIPSPFAEVYQKQLIHYSGVTYLQNISTIWSLDSISSGPVRICFCNSEQKPYCSYQPPSIRVMKGEGFSVSLVAVDQVNHTVNAYIISSSTGGFGEGQQIQSVTSSCTNITFNVFSLHDSETIKLYPDGPCASANMSTRHLTIDFLNCTCPIGFEPQSNGQLLTKCDCICDPALSPYIITCNVTTKSVLRSGTNSWISYMNNTDPTGYVIYPICPFDYCQPLTENVTIDFNLPNGSDSQCAFDRTGVLCGRCKDNLSLSLASSRCVPCHTYWPAQCTVIILVAVIAGIALVSALLALNITVSVGLINGFIFYANIVSPGQAVFFPSSEPSFPSVFVAWLNLNIGIDVCFIDGLDTYIKTWLQLAFPLYIISLVVMVIIISEHSSKFARLIGKRDPVSTLATLVLLSYAKLLSTTITSLSSAVLHYPDGRKDTVWLADASVPFLRGKHIPLALVAFLIIILGLPYTILLLLWQWIVRAPRLKIFRWTRNTKLNAFIVTHHVPHNSKHRYWTGLLLVLRVVLYITASVTMSSNPQTLPLITNAIIGAIFLVKCLFGVRVYTSKFVDVIDTLLYFNLLILSATSQYEFRANITKQTVVAYTSTAVTLTLLVGVLCYHVYMLIRKRSPPRDGDGFELLLAPLERQEEVTHSFIELPRREHQRPLQSTLDHDQEEAEIIRDDESVPSPLYYTPAASY